MPVVEKKKKIYIYIHIYIRYIYIYIYIYILHVCVCVCIYVFICVCLFVCTIYMQWLCVNVSVYKGEWMVASLCGMRCVDDLNLSLYFPYPY